MSLVRSTARATGRPAARGADRPGKDFLSRTVAAVMAGFAVKVQDLPAYTLLGTAGLARVGSEPRRAHRR